MPGNCGYYTSTPADQLVTSGWRETMGIADDAMDRASHNLTTLSGLLGNVPIRAVNAALGWTGPSSLGAPFQKPAAPQRPDLGFAPPAKPGTFAPGAITPPQLSSRPTFDTTRPQYRAGAVPGMDGVGGVPAAPNLSSPTMPSYNGGALPAVPSLESLAVPSFGNLTVATLALSLPTDMDTPPAAAFAWDETAYQPAVLSTIQGEVSRVLSGEMGLPTTIWDALWSRGADRDLETKRRAVQEAQRRHGSRGWGYLGGAGLAREEEALRAAQEADAERNRELTIRAATMAREDFWTAVTQGIALDQLLSQLFTQVADRRLRAAMFAQEASERVYNLLVARHNLLLGAADRKIAKFRGDIEAQGLALQAERLRLDAATENSRATSAMNKDRVALYAAQSEGLRVAVAEYHERVAAAEVELKKGTQELERYAQQINAGRLGIEAKALEWDGYKAQLGENEIMARVYQADAGVFAEQMRGYSAATEAEKVRIDAELGMSRLRLDQTRVELDRYRADWAGIAESTRAAALVFDGEAKLYQAELSAEDARVRADTMQFNAAEREAEARANLEAKQADLAIQQVMRLTELEIDGIKAIYQTESQIGSAALAAVNLSASTRAGYSESIGCTTSYSVGG